ncbi:hypothetical protein ENBRE01_2315 [Enteropsectra breve]|nr:hypothetical protein ENBRE01_2315 [Enteropsectra breve]
MMIGAVNLILAMISYSKCASQNDETHLHAPLVANAPLSPNQPQTEEHPVATPGRKDDDLSKTRGDKKGPDLQVNEKTTSNGYNEFIKKIHTLVNDNNSFMERIKLDDYQVRLDPNYTIGDCSIDKAFENACKVIDSDSKLFKKHLRPFCHMLALLNGVFKNDKESFISLITNTKENIIQYEAAKIELESIAEEDLNKKKVLEDLVIIYKKTISEDKRKEIIRYSLLYRNITLSRNIEDYIVKHAHAEDLSDATYCLYGELLNDGDRTAYEELQKYRFYQQFFGVNEVKPNGDGAPIFKETPKVEEKIVTGGENKPPVGKATKADLEKRRNSLIKEYETAQTELEEIALKYKKLKESIQIESKKIDEKRTAAPENSGFVEIQKNIDTAKELDISVDEFNSTIAAILSALEKLRKLDLTDTDNGAAVVTEEENILKSVQEKLSSMDDKLKKANKSLVKAIVGLGCLYKLEQLALREKEREKDDTKNDDKKSSLSKFCNKHKVKIIIVAVALVLLIICAVVLITTMEKGGANGAELV